MSYSRSNITALVLGTAAGMRTFLPLAMLALAAQEGKLSLRRTPLKWGGSLAGAAVLGALSAAELVGDKLPGTPSRIALFPLIARTASGAVAGATVAVTRRDSQREAALCGALGAIIGSFAGYHLRRYSTETRRTPPILTALIEDAVALGAAAGALQLLD